MKHCYTLKDQKITEVNIFGNNNMKMYEAPQRAVANILSFSKSYKTLNTGNKCIGIIVN